MYTLNSDVIVKETRNTSYPWDMCAFGMICHFTKINCILRCMTICYQSNILNITNIFWSTEINLINAFVACCLQFPHLSDKSDFCKLLRQKKKLILKQFYNISQYYKYINCMSLVGSQRKEVIILLKWDAKGFRTVNKSTFAYKLVLSLYYFLSFLAYYIDEWVRL